MNIPSEPHGQEQHAATLEALGFHPSLFSASGSASNGSINGSFSDSILAKQKLEEDNTTPPSFFCPITQVSQQPSNQTLLLKI